jgi:hypothetical protein
MTCRYWALLALASVALALPTRGADDQPSKADLDALKAAGVATDNDGLMGFVRKRTVSEALRARIADLIRDLGHDEYATRARAQTDLVEIGGPARPQLRAALGHTDLETRVRARRALEKIGPASAEANLVTAAARALAARKAPGACAVLLDFMPSIEEPETADDVALLLTPLVLDRDGKPEPAALKALSDRYPVKRWAAAAALARATKEQRATVHKLLTDADPGVRRHLALALLDVKDKEGVPALISLLDGKSSVDTEIAEEVLVSIAGDRAPPAPDSDLGAARLRYRKAWENWWTDNKGTVDLARVDFTPSGHGYTLVGVLALVGKRVVGTSNKVLVMDASMKVKWEIDNLNYPVYACMTRRDRALVCEYNGNRVVERDSKGRTVWEKRLTSQPVHAQRLSNGNTFIATRYQLLEVDRGGREVKTITRSSHDILSACRHKDGSFTVLSSTGQCIKLDSTGRQTRAFRVGYMYPIGLKAAYLPKGSVVVPDYSSNKVREYDSTGRTVVEFTSYRPNSVTKLANGNYLVCSRLNNTLIEYDKEGRQVTAHSVPGAVRPVFAERK